MKVGIIMRNLSFTEKVLPRPASVCGANVSQLEENPECLDAIGFCKVGCGNTSPDARKKIKLRQRVNAELMRK